jgi:hypothetical protein
MTRNKHTYTSFFTANTFFRTLHIIQTHCKHLCRETRPRLSVLHAQMKACRTIKKKKRTGGWDKKITWFRSLPSFIPHPFRFLCVSSIQPTLEPSLTSFSSLPIPPHPLAILSTQTPPPAKSKKCGKAFDELFRSSFPLFSLVITIYHWITYFF